VLDFFGTIGGAIMAPLYYVISAVLVGWHKLFGSIFGPATGIAWVLSIIGLTLVIRMALIPLFVKQIKSSRNMQLLQPKVRELQKKHGHDREKLGQETMKLYRENNANPLSSCLPLLLQLPIFLALFRVLDGAARGIPRGHWLVINPDLRRSDLRHLLEGWLRQRHYQRAHRDVGADPRNDHHLVHYAAAADAQEHAAGRADRTVRAAAEDHAVRLPTDLRCGRH
jgi:YidC/Oxa1 family membrane protein insertase